MAANKRLAVVIGNSIYPNWTHLKKAANDARAVKDQLERLGYDAHLKLDLTRDDIYEHLGDILDTWKHDASEIVLFYAGHGVGIGKLYCYC